MKSDLQDENISAATPNQTAAQLSTSSSQTETFQIWQQKPVFLLLPVLQPQVQ